MSFMSKEVGVTYKEKDDKIVKRVVNMEDKDQSEVIRVERKCINESVILQFEGLQSGVK